MKRIDLTIKALSPLAIGKQKHGGSISEVENYIPGSVIRGAIAAQILQESNQKNTNFTENDGDFYSLFLSDNPAIFHNAYPAVAKIGESYQTVSNDIRVLPATAVSSKAEPGFKSEDKKRGGVFDTLIDRFCAEAHHHPYDPNCPKDGGRVEPFSGFYTQDNDEYCSCSVSSRFLTRVGINRQRATAEDDILYSIEVLNESFAQNPKNRNKNWEQVTYRSAILVPDAELGDRLKAFIESHTFRLGGSASRGLGKVEIRANDDKIVEAVDLRLEDFNRELEKQWKRWSSVFGQTKDNRLSERTYFTLDLQSDAILIDNWRRTTVISESLLKQFTGLQDPDLKLEVAYSSYDYCSGWNSAWGLMKDVELVTNKGAVYLFSVNKEREEEWIEALEELELKGVGDRTCEGFGQVRICDEFHLVFRPEAV